MPDFAPNPRPVPGTITGERGPESQNTVRVVAQVDDTIYRYMPEASPLTVLTKRAKQTRVVPNYRFDYLIGDEYPRGITLSAASLVADVTLDFVAGDGSKVPQDAILRNTRTGELVLVTTPGANGATVVRGVGSTQVDMVAGDQLVFMYVGSEDGSGKGTLLSTADLNDFNYTQIFKTAFGMTGRDLQTELYGGPDLSSEKAKHAVEHAKSIEFSAFFGTRFSRTGTLGHLQTFTGGLEYFTKSNVWDLNGTVPSERSFVEFLEEAMKWGEGGSINGTRTKYLFCSSRWLTEIEFWAKDRLQTRSGETTFGLALREYQTVHGRVMLVYDPILDYYNGDMAFLIDLNHVRRVAHKGRDTEIQQDIQAPDIDGREFQYFSDIGWQFTLEGANAVLKGLPQ